jgi:hypothetical protein
MDLVMTPYAGDQRTVGIDGQDCFGCCHCGSLPAGPSKHLRPFAMETALPSADYYDRSVTRGLAARRRSRVQACQTSERDVGPLFVPFNDLVGRRSRGGGFGRRK